MPIDAYLIEFNRCLFKKLKKSNESCSFFLDVFFSGINNRNLTL